MDSSARFDNQLRVTGFDKEHQQMLQEASVLVVGSGGLGCPVLRQLTVLGIGEMTLVDDDKVSVSNLNRQTLFTPDDAGEYKVSVAKERLLQLSPGLSIKVLIDRLNSKNVGELVKGKNVVVDCTDNLATRYVLDKACAIRNIPLVFGGVRMMEGQFGVFNYGNGRSFSDIFPMDGHLEALEDCNTLGTFGFACELIASYQVAEVMKIITGLGEVSYGCITTIDLLDNVSFKAKKN